MPFIESRTSAIYSFTPPSLTLDLSLGHKDGDWYLLFAHQYPSADSREVVRLNKPHGRPTCALKLGNPHFLFDLEVASGWEKEGQTLLEFLLDLDPNEPAILRDWGAEKDGQTTEVEVLIPEHRMLHHCDGCRVWESTTDKDRWVRVRKCTLPQYFCPTCYEKCWRGPRLARLSNKLLLRGKPRAS